MRQVKQFVGPTPGKDLTQSISASDEEQVHITATLPAQILRVSTVYVSPDDRYRPATPKRRIRRRRDDGHEVAILGLRNPASLLLPRHAGGNENDLVEVESGRNLRGCDEVAMMNGVEGATHHPEPVAASVRTRASPSSTLGIRNAADPCRYHGR